MTWPRLRFRIWWLMGATAALAVVMARFGVAPACALVLMAVAALTPVALAPERLRLETALWVGALHPLLTLVYLHATWLAAWCVLGHQPRIYIADADSLGLIVEVLTDATFFSLLLTPLAFGFGVAVVVVAIQGRSVAPRLLALAAAWLVGLYVWSGDPFQVLAWFID